MLRVCCGEVIRDTIDTVNQVAVVWFSHFLILQLTMQSFASSQNTGMKNKSEAISTGSVAHLCSDWKFAIVGHHTFQPRILVDFTK